MSEKTKTNDPIVITAVPENAEETVVEEKQSFVAKTKHFVKRHKKPAIAVGALVALVGVAAVTGRKTDPLPDFENLNELENPEHNDVVEGEILDTTTA